MKKLILIIVILFGFIVNGQTMKIVYKTDSVNVIGWVNKVADSAYILKTNEYFGDIYRKPILNNGVIIEGWNDSDQLIFEQDSIQRSKDRDSSAMKTLNHITDGKRYLKRILDQIDREFDNGNITENQYNSINTTLFDAVLPLEFGRWKIASSRIDALPDPSNAKLLAIKNKIQQIVDKYISENNL